MPFLSVTGSDFMEMFVGVGASRVRDLFQSARKMGRAIIFVDEIDSIGRKRGAGLGGGHDEREQTLNQMLSEMDGFEATEGIVMIGATNRPGHPRPGPPAPGPLRPPGRRPLPELSERREILGVHAKSKRLAPDVDLEVVARGTPGMSGADLANLVNEAALFAVRSGDEQIHQYHFDMARDRVLMGARRESMALSDREKEAIAYHEAGHAVAAAVLPQADPVPKVTILPMGMALGVTQQLPMDDRHIYRQDYIEDSLVVRMGGRIAEELVFGVISTGANNDLVGSTELARKMVREWGMSDRVGPMAWGSQGAVFLGDDLMHSRDYSDETARVIDEEVERILREQEERCRDTSPSTASASTSWPRCSSTRRSTAPRSTASSPSVGRAHRHRGVRRVARAATGAARGRAASSPPGGRQHRRSPLVPTHDGSPARRGAARSAPRRPRPRGRWPSPVPRSWPPPRPRHRPPAWRAQRRSRSGRAGPRSRACSSSWTATASLSSGCPLPDAGARVARGRGEHGDEPRRPAERSPPDRPGGARQ